MRTMMLALTDQEGGVGMNESPDRLGQTVFQRLPCSSFKRQQTPQYILRSRSFAILSFHVFRKHWINCNYYRLPVHCQFRAGKAISDTCHLQFIN